MWVSCRLKPGVAIPCAIIYTDYANVLFIPASDVQISIFKEFQVYDGKTSDHAIVLWMS